MVSGSNYETRIKSGIGTAMKIEIVSPVQVRKGNTNGRDWEIFEQSAYLHTDGKKYPEEMKVQVQGQNAAYPVGMYELSTDSSNFYISRYGQLTLTRELKLDPLAHKPTSLPKAG